MKKFYAFAAAAIAAVSMNAQIYFVGNGEGLAWDPATPVEATLENGAYTIEIKNLIQFKMSTAMGDWDTFNASAVHPASAPSEDNLGTAIALEAGDADIYTPWKGDYKIVVPADLSTITLTALTPKPTGPVEIYVRGGMNNWGNDGFGEGTIMEDWKFKNTGENTYELACQIEANVEFKIADADWGSVNYSADGVAPINDPMPWVYNAGNNTTLAEDFDGIIYVMYDGEGMEVELVPSAGVADVAVDANAPAEYFNLQGVRVANPENGLFIVRQGGKVTKVVK